MSTPDDALAPPGAAAPAEAVSSDVPASDAVRPSGSVKRAALWTLIGYGGAQIIRFASQVILTNDWLSSTPNQPLVKPDVFGQISLVYAFMTGLHMFTDVGIATSLIQSKRGDDPDFYNTAWTLQILRGGVLSLGTLLIAWPVSLALGQPLFLLLLPAVGLNSLIEAFTSTALPTLKRHLLLERYVILDLSTSIIGSVTTVAYVVWVAPTAWAMVVGPMVNFFGMMVVSHFIMPGYRNRFRWDRSALTDLLQFGKWIFLGTICTFLAFQAAPIVIDAFMHLDRSTVEAETEVGIYNTAANLVGIATLLMGTLATQLVFPLYSRWHQAGRDIRREFGRIHGTAAGIAALLATGMLATGPAAIRTIYAPAYHDAGWIMRVLAIGAWFSMLEGNVGALLLALGQPRSVMLSNATKLAGLVIFVPLGYWLGYLYGGALGSFKGLLCGFVISDFARYLMVLGLAWVHGLRGWPYDLALTVLIVVIAPLGYWLGEEGTIGLLGSAPATRLEQMLLFGFQGVIVTALWAGVGLVWWRRSKQMFRPQEAA